MTTVDLREAEVPDKMDMWEATDPYFEWIEREGIKRIVDYKFEDLNDVELGNWERKGGKGAVINIPSSFLPNDAHLVEIKPGGKSEPEHHIVRRGHVRRLRARCHERLAERGAEGHVRVDGGQPDGDSAERDLSALQRQRRSARALSVHDERAAGDAACSAAAISSSTTTSSSRIASPARTRASSTGRARSTNARAPSSARCGRPTSSRTRTS